MAGWEKEGETDSMAVSREGREGKDDGGSAQAIPTFVSLVRQSPEKGRGGKKRGGARKQYGTQRTTALLGRKRREGKGWGPLTEGKRRGKST